MAISTALLISDMVGFPMFLEVQVEIETTISDADSMHFNIKYNTGIQFDRHWYSI